MILLSAKSRVGSRIALNRWGGGGLAPYISLMIAMWHLRGMVLSHFGLQLGVNIKHFGREFENVYGIDRPRMRTGVDFRGWI